MPVSVAATSMWNVYQIQDPSANQILNPDMSIPGDYQVEVCDETLPVLVVLASTVGSNSGTLLINGVTIIDAPIYPSVSYAFVDPSSLETATVSTFSFEAADQISTITSESSGCSALIVTEVGIPNIGIAPYQLHWQVWRIQDLDIKTKLSATAQDFFFGQTFPICTSRMYELVVYVGPDFNGEITISVNFNQIFSSSSETFSGKLQVFFDSTGVKFTAVDQIDVDNDDDNDDDENSDTDDEGTTSEDETSDDELQISQYIPHIAGGLVLDQKRLKWYQFLFNHVKHSLQEQFQDQKRCNQLQSPFQKSQIL
jgi:hypothetical protein